MVARRGNPRVAEFRLPRGRPLRADDQDAGRRSPPAGPYPRLGLALADPHHAVLHLHVVARDRIQRGSAQRLARPQIEASVMPRTPDGAIDEQPLAGGLVMRALAPTAKTCPCRARRTGSPFA